MLLVATLPFFAILIVSARLLHSIPEDTHAFPKFRVAFLNRLPLLNQTAQRWLTDGLRGGELEFLDQPWSNTQHTPASPKEIDGVDASQPSTLLPTTTNYTLEKMKIGTKVSYLCLIPKPVDNILPVTDDDPSDFEITPSRSWSLLQPLSGTCLYHRQGWFTYSYCHNEEIRQFKEAANSAAGHIPPQEDTEWEAYTLGKAPKPGVDLTVAEQNAQAHNLELARGAGSRYLVQRWGDGTVCDKTGRSREVEVQFHCSMTMTDTIVFVKETKTCSYVLVINTPRLCSEPGFKSRRDTGEEHQIRCREIVDMLPPAGTTDEQARLPDLDYPVNPPRHKPVLPAPPAKEAKSSELKGATYGSVLRKTLEAILGGKDGKPVTLEEMSDNQEDGVVFQIVDEVDLTDGQLETVDQITDALRAAGYDVKSMNMKSTSDKGSDSKSGSAQAQGKKGKKPAKGAKGEAWREEL